MERGYASGYSSPSSQRYTLRAPSEPPSGGLFYGQTCLVTGGGGIVGHALIGRILREGGSVIAVRARVRAARRQTSRSGNATTTAASQHGGGGAIAHAAPPHTLLNGG